MTDCPVDFWLDGKPGNMVKIGSVKLVNFRPEFGAYLSFFGKLRSYAVKCEPGAKGSGLHIARLRVG
jgi:hypothetical protein